MIHLYYGDGKGKTTTALGVAIRFAGSGGSVLFAQFLKDSSSSERAVLSQINGITLTDCPKTLKFVCDMNKSEFLNCSAYYTSLLNQIALYISRKQFDMIILDEITSLIDCNILSITSVINLINNCKEKAELILTGHKVSNEIIDICDYVTELKKIRHPYDKGMTARLGIEF